MDKYQKLRAEVERVSKEIIGKPIEEAVKLCQNAGLACRTMSNNGNGCMVTADCRMDRIGFVTEGGIVTETSNG